MAVSEPGSDRVSQLVVVGASAGGVEALITLVASLPPDFPAPIVVAQHPDPQRPSGLASLLASRSPLPVQTVTSSEPLHAGTIYVVPADLDKEQHGTNAELESGNEELQAIVGELRATIGDLSAANDELHARSAEMETTTATLEAEQRTSDLERERLAAILTNMGDAVLVVDADGQPLLTNAAYERLFGPTAEFVPQDDAGNPLPEAVWPQRRAARQAAATLPFTMIGPDGARRWFECNTQPVQGGAGERWGVLVIRDITDRSLRRRQEEFLAVAAHELRTPLTALSGRLQLLMRRLGQQPDERLREHAVKALEQARRLEIDIGELMDGARLRFGSLVLDVAPLDLRDVVRQAVDGAEPLAAGQALRMELPESPVSFTGDARRLERVLLNLLANAITYAPGTERIDVRLRREGNEAVIEVEDTGPGIPPESLPNIFDRFFQMEQGGQGGLGLGLYIAREIVTAHGGTIEARSTVGQGTTLVIRLPLTSVTEPGRAEIR